MLSHIIYYTSLLYYFTLLYIKRILTDLVVTKNTVNHIGNTLRITYSYNDQEYDLYVPYDAQAECDHIAIYGEDHFGRVQTIRHQPGLPMLIRKKDLGLKRIIKITLDDEEIELEEFPTNSMH